MSFIFCVLLIAPLFLLIGIYKLCFQRKLGNKRDQFGTLHERMKKKLFFGYAELINTMSNEDLKVLQQTYENTIKNAQSIKVQGVKKVKNLSKRLKKVLFVDELDQITTEQSTLI
ncbi:unnamed protein product [Paramecium primaurelia]|uniref:Uncharacterized protein n=1 Tax=Paramecium primaurelia TaxID=5886 RepID=A0A8S1KSY4_PARPR|nr:unnamed protein product [Paramecium primaurelia]